MDELIERVHEAVDAIDRRVKQERREHFGKEVAMGADGTPTAHIDKIAEEVALEVIGREANILSEEIGYIDNGKEYTVIMDPIDGTRNAIHGIPFYCASIAIGTHDLKSVEYGIVKNLPTGDCYEAIRGEGAFLNGHEITVAHDTSDLIYILVLGTSGNEKTWRLASKFTTRSLGAAALEMCMVASGAAHAYYMPRELLRITDFAAGTLMVREAGGGVYTADGEVLNVAADLSVRSSVLAVANADIMEVLV
ncbi:MAG: inositol monophosphatase [Thermoplasmata archaeon]|nr:MAG: inositol monophosphatase [Thermoplasmata archaeon]